MVNISKAEAEQWFTTNRLVIIVLNTDNTKQVIFSLGQVNDATLCSSEKFLGYSK